MAMVGELIKWGVDLSQGHWTFFDKGVERRSIQTCQKGGAANSAPLLGGGTGASPNSTDDPNVNFIEWRCKTEADDAGSDTRLMYLRTYFAGATTGGGETLRAFTTLQAAVGTARGAHISLNFDSGGTVSGLATALSATLHIPNTGTPGGTKAALEAQLYFDSGDDDNVTIGTHAILRLSVAGDSGTVANATDAIEIDVPAGCRAAAGTSLLKMVTTGIASPTITDALRIRIPGVGTRFIPLVTTIAAP